MEKEIKNIVFYDFIDENNETVIQTCIFYEDGTVFNTNEEEGKEIFAQFVNEKNLDSDTLKQYINQKYVFKMSGKDFESNFNNFRKSDKPMTSINLVNPVPVVEEVEEIEELDYDPNEVVIKPDSEENKKEAEEGFIAKIKKFAPFAAIGAGIAGVIAKRKERKKNKITLLDRIKSKFNDIKRNKDEMIENYKSSRLGKPSLTEKLKRFTAATLAVLTLGLVGTGCAENKKEETAPADKKIAGESLDDMLAINSYDNIVNKSASEVQKNAFHKYSNVLNNFNILFADKHIEAGSNIRAALTWDEVVAMDLVYNNYTKAEIEQIFNGAELDGDGLKNAFKTAQLILMGAHVIENRDCPVDMSVLINSQEGKDFYNKYHELFLKAKEATGDAKINAVNAFYAELYKDFPITDEVRQNGIAHSDYRNELKSYKYSIVPMVSAAEIMFQDLEIDYTLEDKAVDYFNDLGVCQEANDIIDKVVLVSLMAEENSEYAKYDKVKEAKIKELTDKGYYNISDSYRDLSQLEKFKREVNVAFEYEGEAFTGETVFAYTNSGSYQGSSSSSYTTTTTKTTSSREEAVSATSESEVKAAEDKVNKEIEKENSNAKAEAEKASKEKAEKLQKEANEKAKEYEEKVKQYNEDLKKKIDEANKNINSGNTVNEKDLGHGVDFDNNHSDSKGNLDESVKDITTDSTGSYSASDPLPDPNKTGAQFDAGNTQSQNEIIANEVVEQAAAGNEEAWNYIYSYEESNSDYSESVVVSNEDSASYSEAENVVVSNDSFQYTR